jgi:hypothetical protein
MSKEVATRRLVTAPLCSNPTRRVASVPIVLIPIVSAPLHTRFLSHLVPNALSSPQVALPTNPALFLDKYQPWHPLRGPRSANSLTSHSRERATPANTEGANTKQHPMMHLHQTPHKMFPDESLSIARLVQLVLCDDDPARIDTYRVSSPLPGGLTLKGTHRLRSLICFQMACKTCMASN